MAGRLLLQEDLPRHRLDVRVGKRHANREPVHELLKERHTRQRALAGGHENDLALEFLGDSLGHFGEEHRAVVGVADVLLRLVENEDGAREPCRPFQPVAAPAWRLGGNRRS